MTQLTSTRHTDLLNGYKSGESRFREWADEHLGNLHLLHWEAGEIRMRWDMDEHMIMPDGVMFGGHISSVADHVVGLTTMTVLSEETDRFRTSRLETNFFRPLKMPRATVEGKITNLSRSLVHVEADFYNSDDRLAVRSSAVQVLTGNAERALHR